tara:strand:+ start:1748 stop:2137 length:390 start_codon:yes stop_codon:yes gene_type:complete
MNLILDRNIKSSHWNMGSLSDADFPDFELATLENPWQNNEPYVSCIPEGDYICKRVDSPRYGNTFQVQDVEGRTHILFHWGNYERNTLGCILVGLTQIPSKDMIGSSRKGFAKFIKHTQGVNEFTLTIQ